MRLRSRRWGVDTESRVECDLTHSKQGIGFPSKRPCRHSWPTLRQALGFLALATLLLSAPGAILAGTVSGTGRNGTNRKTATGCEVILIQLQGGMQPVATSKTDSNGHYRFDHPTLGTAPMLLRAVYRG